MSASRYVVISDLHVSAGKLDDCDPEIEEHLCRFLESLRSGTELIINGDFLDFAQAPPEAGSDLESQTAANIPLCFTEDQSTTKLKAIIHAHPAVFTSLGEFLARSLDSRLTILPGNHDPDFFWGRVQDVFRGALGSAAHPGNVTSHLEQVYRPIPELWVEHGHQFDDVNGFFVGGQPRWSAANPPISRDESDHERLIECVGTRFLIRQINALDREYPFVDNIKPFSLFLRLFAVSGVSRVDGPLKVLVAAYGMLAYLAKTALTRPGDFLSQDTKHAGSPPARLLTVYTALSKADQRAFDGRVENRGFPLKGRPVEYVLKNAAEAPALLVFLADHLDLVDMLEISGSSMLGADNGTLSLGPAFLADETAALKCAAKKILARPNAPTCVVMGHTHEAVNDSGYKNIGS